MSNARNLADVISGNYDVPAGSLDNVDLSSRVAKSGDTMTGDLIVDAKVGIGTSSPAVRFHVSGSSTYVAGIEGSSAYALMGFKASGTTGTLADANVAIGANGDALYFRSGGAERMRIDSAGRVTMPYQPAFRAKQSGNTTYDGSAVIQHNAAQLNVGSHYSTSTYRFTAPVSGVYFFSWGHLVQSKNGSSSVYSNVFINGTRLFPQAWQTNSSNQFTMTYSAVFFMNAGDYAEHRMSTSDTSVSLYYEETGFSGYLLG